MQGEPAILQKRRLPGHDGLRRFPAVKGAENSGHPFDNGGVGIHPVNAESVAEFGTKPELRNAAGKEIFFGMKRISQDGKTTAQLDQIRETFLDARKEEKIFRKGAFFVLDTHNSVGFERSP